MINLKIFSDYVRDDDDGLEKIKRRTMNEMRKYMDERVIESFKNITLNDCINNINKFIYRLIDNLRTNYPHDSIYAFYADELISIISHYRYEISQGGLFDFFDKFNDICEQILEYQYVQILYNPQPQEFRKGGARNDNPNMIDIVQSAYDLMVNNRPSKITSSLKAPTGGKRRKKVTKRVRTTGKRKKKTRRHRN